MTNYFDLVRKYSGLWPVESLYNVGQLAYVLRSCGDSYLADQLETWKARMESCIESEFNEKIAHGGDDGGL